MQEPMLRQVGQWHGPIVRCTVDGRPVEARSGQSVLTVLLTQGSFVRRHDVDGSRRAGFCLMGACQDCWVWFGPDSRGRACTTLVEEGMRISTSHALGENGDD